jgi:hypothetical protein
MWLDIGLQGLRDTQDKVNGASSVLQETGFEVFKSLGTALATIDELASSGATRTEPLRAEDSWQRLLAALQTIRVAVLAAQEEKALSETVAEQLITARERVEQSLYDFLVEYRADVAYGYRSDPRGDEALRSLDRAIEHAQATRLVAEARGARDEVQRVLDTTQRAAGAVGEGELALAFGGYAERERRVADVLRAVCALALLGITVLAAVLLFGRSGDGPTVSEELAHLAVGVPIAALAAYLGRESTRHRAAARWAHELELQLRTLNAYCEPLDGDARMQLRTDFGRRVFLTDGAPPARVDEAGPSAAGDATNLLQQALTLLRAPVGR